MSKGKKKISKKELENVSGGDTFTLTPALKTLIKNDPKQAGLDAKQYGNNFTKPQREEIQYLLKNDKDPRQAYDDYVDALLS